MNLRLGRVLILYSTLVSRHGSLFPFEEGSPRRLGLARACLFMIGYHIVLTPSTECLRQGNPSPNVVRVTATPRTRKAPGWHAKAATLKRQYASVVTQSSALCLLAQTKLAPPTALSNPLGLNKTGLPEELSTDECSCYTLSCTIRYRSIVIRPRSPPAAQVVQLTLLFSASNSALAGPDSVSILILRLLERDGINRRNFRRPQMRRARVVTNPIICTIEIHSAKYREQSEQGSA